MGISPRHVRPPRPVGPMPVPSAIALPQPPQAVAQRLFHMAIRPAHVREISGASPPACQLPQLRSVDDPAYQIGRAHVCTPVTNAHLVCRLLLEKKKSD